MNSKTPKLAHYLELREVLEKSRSFLAAEHAGSHNGGTPFRLIVRSRPSVEMYRSGSSSLCPPALLAELLGDQFVEALRDHLSAALTRLENKVKDTALAAQEEALNLFLEVKAQGTTKKETNQ